MPNPAGGSSLHPGQQKELREDNPTFLAGDSSPTAEQICDGNPTQDLSSSHPCQQTRGAKTAAQPTPHPGFDSKGNEQSMSCFPNHTKCSRDAGRAGELTPNITINPALPHSPIPGPAWRKNKRNQPQSPRGSWKSSFPHQAPNPTEQTKKSQQYRSSKA